MRRALAVLGCFLMLATLQFVGVIYLYRPLVAAQPVNEPLVPRALGFMISMALVALFYDWVNDQMRHPLRAALTVAVSQILLVDVDYVLSGDRTVAGGAASALILLVSWVVAGLTYGRIRQSNSA